jgi:superfamily II DNA or RNA helicase
MGGMRRIWMPKKDEATKQRLADLVKRFGYTGAISDFTDVPDQTDKTVYIDLSGEQKKAVANLMMNEADPLARASRLRTIENGVLYGKKIEELEGKVDLMTKRTTIFQSHKIDYILERAQEFPKLLVFINYTAQIEETARILRENGYTVYTLTGQTKDRSFIKTVDESNSPCVVIAQSSVSAGWELPSFPCVIFASLSWRTVDHIQAKGRVLRMNKLKKNLYIYLVVKGGKDEECYKSIMAGNDFIEKMNAN